MFFFQVCVLTLEESKAHYYHSSHQNAMIDKSMDAFFVSTINSEVIHPTLWVLSILLELS